MVPEQTMRCAGPVYARVCTMCACLTLDRAEVTSQQTCLHMCVNAVIFLRCIHPVRLQCDIREIYGYFSRMRTNTRAVCTRPPFFVGGLGMRLGIYLIWTAPW